MKTTLTRFIAITLLISCLNSAQAASILGVCSTNADLDRCKASKLFFPTYEKTGSTFDFNFRVDQGAIGDIDEDTAYNTTIDILDLWEAESSLAFVDTGRLSQDITGNNFASVLETSNPLGFSPIVFDDDGEITDALFGNGAKSSVLGFAGATFFNTSGESITGIRESQAVFNGFLFSGAGGGGSLASILVEFKTTILHEFGHMFGLDHAQGGNLEDFNDGTGDQEDIPVMFPFAANPLVELQHDDIASVRAVYPVGNEASSFGTITGTLVKNGTKVRGANVVAFLTDDSNPRKRAVSGPSDVNGAGDGAFLLPNLIPGTYVVKAEPIDSEFTGGSSLGLYDPISSNNMTTGFYNGDGNNIIATNNLNTGISQAQQITVTAGQTNNIVFDIGDNPGGTDGGTDDTNGSTAEATFTLGGKAVKQIIRTKNFKTIIVKL
ncbi:MAG: hypothetical protein O3C63_06750, partial [Cyanobacteria bacterium]|nr:hypothetical protein [Cyanobacteriota bacterium]MDA1021282.1 hypothetical protein [Cyanobacteriota bacterium]